MAVALEADLSSRDAPDGGAATAGSRREILIEVVYDGADLAVVAEGAGLTPAEVVARVYADVHPRLWPAAEQSVRAQLDYLAESPA